MTDHGTRTALSVPPIDPVCAFHGKKWSEHEEGRCLYCCLCFRSDVPPDQWFTDKDGVRWDICMECAGWEGLE